MKTTIECTCPNCGSEDLEDYDADVGPNVTLDVVKCRKCLLNFTIKTVFANGLYRITVENQWRDDTMYLITGEGATCPIHALAEKAPHLLTGQNAVFAMHFADEEMYVFSEQPFTVEEAMQELEARYGND